MQMHTHLAACPVFDSAGNELGEQDFFWADDEGSGVDKSEATEVTIKTC